MIKLNSQNSNLKWSKFDNLLSFLGAFVIPYIIILIVVGKPGYFLEMIMGQFSSRGTVKVFDCVPAMRGEWYLK